MQEKPNYQLAKVLILLAGVGMIVGSFLPWGIVASGIFSQSVYGGDGIIIAIIGSFVTLSAFSKPKSALAIGVVVLGSLSAAIIATSALIRGLPEFFDTTSEVTTSIGLGLPLIGISCLIGFGGASMFGEITSEERQQRLLKQQEKYASHLEEQKKKEASRSPSIEQALPGTTTSSDRLSAISATALILCPIAMIFVKSEPLGIGLGLAAVAGLVGLSIANWDAHVH